MKYPTINKDITTHLSDWGPYSKHLAGISHIENNEIGEMLEFSVFPGYFRGPIQPPCEVWQGNCYPWYASDDLGFYTYRFELEWKDRVYADVSFLKLDDNSVIVKSECVNNSEIEQNLCLHYLANRFRPKCNSVKGADFSIDPLCYTEIEIKSNNRLSGLTPDGKLLCEDVREDYVSGHALGGRCGKSNGDRVKYSVTGVGDGALYLHVKGTATLKIVGDTECEITVEESQLKFINVPVKISDSLEIIVTQSGEIVIDAICLTRDGEAPEIKAFDLKARPNIETSGNKTLLTYEEMDNCYGIAWQGEYSLVREYWTSNINYLMPYTTQMHASNRFGNDRSNQYTDIFVRSIPLAPGEKKVLYGMLCCGDKDTVANKLNEFENIGDFSFVPSVPVDSDRYSLGQRLMKTTLLTNVVYPIRLQGNYVRHFTPGKWWDSLYTWDNGFIAMSFCDFALDFAKDSLEMYLTEPGNLHSAFIHHGSMLPIQIYVLKRIFDVTGDKEYLKKNYDSMRQYYDFYVGRSPLSHTKDLKSGLLSTFRYFYNSGGWDDYPPQKYIHSIRSAESFSTGVNTSHAINFARIMAHFAEVLNLPADDYFEDIENFSAALQKYSYDEESGYFSFVHHNENGEPDSILKHSDGQNFNMGLDGAYPMLAGVCNEKQTKELADRIMSSDRMWTDIGISVVDKSAVYYNPKGYWNGSVWMPHQWFAFMGMLENGFDEYAEKIAFTALEVWKRETDYSYRCCEHFMVDSKRGAGWMNFGALSSPVVMWYQSFYKPENITIPFNLRIEDKNINEKGITLSVTPLQNKEGSSSVIIVPRKAPARVCVNGEAVDYKSVANAIMLKVNKSCSSKIEIIY